MIVFNINYNFNIRPDISTAEYQALSNTNFTFTTPNFRKMTFYRQNTTEPSSAVKHEYYEAKERLLGTKLFEMAKITNYSFTEPGSYAAIDGQYEYEGKTNWVEIKVNTCNIDKYKSYMIRRYKLERLEYLLKTEDPVWLIAFFPCSDEATGYDALIFNLSNFYKNHEKKTQEERDAVWVTRWNRTSNDIDSPYEKQLMLMIPHSDASFRIHIS